FDRLSAHEEVGVSLLFQGHFSRALQHAEQSIELYNPSEHGSLAYAVAIDRGVHAHAVAAQCHVYLGYPDQALAMSEAAVALAKPCVSLESLPLRTTLRAKSRSEISPASLPSSITRRAARSCRQSPRWPRRRRHPGAGNRPLSLVPDHARDRVDHVRSPQQTAHVAPPGRLSSVIH